MSYAVLKFLVILAVSVNSSVSRNAGREGVSVHGQLSVRGRNLVNKYGQIVQLKGMSLYWSQWQSKYWNADSIKGIRQSCHSNIVRAAMGVEASIGGYLIDKTGQMKLLQTVVEAAIANDMYVIVDWHEEQANTHQADAVEFFRQISKRYGKFPHVIYETFNEPTTQSWSRQLKPYHEAVIRTIRANDPDNIIVVGTPFYSQRVDEAVKDPIKGHTNIMYTLHYYAGTHKQELRNLAQGAINKGLPIFITEYGTDNVDPVNHVDAAESALWWQWADRNNLSYCNWAVCDVREASAALIPNTPANRVCQAAYLTQSGKLVVAQNQK